jgi:hypothetical protein
LYFGVIVSERMKLVGNEIEFRGEKGYKGAAVWEKN